MLCPLTERLRPLPKPQHPPRNNLAGPKIKIGPHWRLCPEATGPVLHTPSPHGDHIEHGRLLARPAPLLLYQSSVKISSVAGGEGLKHKPAVGDSALWRRDTLPLPPHTPCLAAALRRATLNALPLTGQAAQEAARASALDGNESPLIYTTLEYMWTECYTLHFTP